MEEKTSELSGLTVNQRADRVRALVVGIGWTSKEEGDRVIDLFHTAPLQDRAQLYRLVEGHAWNGDWKEGWTVADDEIWNGLNRDQLRRLRDIINGTAKEEEE
jgi:hypothetical protein